MDTLDVPTLLDNAVYIVFGIFFAYLLIEYIYNRAYTSRRVDGPIISSGLLVEGYQGTQSVASGTRQGYDYNILVNTKGHLVLFVQLPRNTAFHMLAIGSKSSVSKLAIEALPDDQLRPISLEGNFPQYFRVYCTPKKEVALLQVLAPDTMAHLADFCRSYNVELYNDSLYISWAAGSYDASDQTTLIEDAFTFIDENKRLLARL